MPIEVRSEVRILSQQEFHALNHRVLGIIFEIHNEFGRFLDERLFKTEIAARCEQMGISARPDVRIRVVHETFHKDYLVDLLLAQGLPVETKAAEALSPAHRAQGLNYLMLIGLQYGTLVNLRPARVEHEFLSTQLTAEKRRHLEVIEKAWQEPDDQSARLKDRIIALLRDWGAFLEVGLYREAVTHFLGGPDCVIKPVPIYSGKRVLGRQRMHLLNDECAFTITAVTGNQAPIQQHQTRLLEHTPLKHIQWINLNHHQIEFSTISKTSQGKIVVAK